MANKEYCFVRDNRGTFPKPNAYILCEKDVGYSWSDFERGIGVGGGDVLLNVAVLDDANYLDRCRVKINNVATPTDFTANAKSLWICTECLVIDSIDGNEITILDEFDLSNITTDNFLKAEDSSTYIISSVDSDNNIITVTDSSNLSADDFLGVI